jgi:hypothetical protein
MTGSTGWQTGGMTTGGPALVPPAQPPSSPRPTGSDTAARSRERRTQLTAAALVAAALAVLGAALGVLWDLISPDTPPGIVSPPGIQVDDVHEAFAGIDGRFAFITAAVGLLAGFAAWTIRRARGPYMAIGLAVGGLLGAMLTNLIGHLLRGTGSYQYTSGGTAYLTHLPLNVQMKGLWFVEPALAALVFSLLVAFAAADDLGRPEVRRRRRPLAPVAPSVLPAPPVPPLQGSPLQGPTLQRPLPTSPPPSLPAQADPSARAESDLQDGGRHRDGPGVP